MSRERAERLGADTLEWAAQQLKRRLDREASLAAEPRDRRGRRGALVGSIEREAPQQAAGGAEPTQQQLEGLLGGALEACERYYQAFQFILWAGKTAPDALAGALFETVGEA